MKIRFDTSTLRKIYDANRVACITPTPHPTRILPWHDLLYIIDGSYTVEVDGQSYYADKDHVLTLPANILHRGTINCDPNTQLIWLLIENEPKDICTSSAEDSLSDDILSFSLCVNVADSPRVRECFEHILLSFISGDKNRTSAYTNLLLSELNDADNKKDYQMQLAEAIKKIIDSNIISMNLSNSDIAKSLGRSVKTVETAFKKHYGDTIHSYSCKKKLKQGKMYLENFPYMTLREISETLHFYDEYHFSRQFKKEYGVSPTEYKRNFFMTDKINFSKIE